MSGTPFFAILKDDKLTHLTSDSTQATEMFVLTSADRMEKVTSLEELSKVFATYLGSSESRQAEDPELTVQRIWQYFRDGCDELQRRLRDESASDETLRSVEENLNEFKKKGAAMLDKFGAAVRGIFEEEDDDNGNKEEGGKAADRSP